jgi:hypothetical protein
MYVNYLKITHIELVMYILCTSDYIRLILLQANYNFLLLVMYKQASHTIRLIRLLNTCMYMQMFYYSYTE